MENAIGNVEPVAGWAILHEGREIDGVFQYEDEAREQLAHSIPGTTLEPLYRRAENSLVSDEAKALQGVANALGIDESADAEHNLDGAVIDLMREKADGVCLRTIQRVVVQIGMAKAILRAALSRVPSQRPISEGPEA